MNMLSDRIYAALDSKLIGRQLTFALIIIATLFILIGCGGQNNNNLGSQSDTIPQSTAAAGQKQCYNYMVHGDTIVLTIKWQDADKFTGTMVYHIREKDRNIGTLQGQRRDSVLLASYEFSSEGVTSIREVAFKQIADYMVEGFGELKADSSGFKFADPLALHFDLNRKLQLVKCL